MSKELDKVLKQLGVLEGRVAELEARPAYHPELVFGPGPLYPSDPRPDLENTSGYWFDKSWSEVI